jgi:hypothetical protein
LAVGICRVAALLVDGEYGVVFGVVCTVAPLLLCGSGASRAYGLGRAKRVWFVL